MCRDKYAMVKEKVHPMDNIIICEILRLIINATPFDLYT